MTKSSVITNRLSITMAGLIIMLIIFSTLISQPYGQHINYNKICAKHSRICAQHILEYIAQHIPKYVHSTQLMQIVPYVKGQYRSAGISIAVQLIIIWTWLISNNRLSRSENLAPG